VFLVLRLGAQLFQSRTVPPESEGVAETSRSVTFPGWEFQNVSLGLNYENRFFCTERDGYMSFTPNRIWHGGRYSVLCVLEIFFPAERVEKAFGMLCSLLRQSALNFPVSRDSVFFLILAVDSDVLPLVRSHSAFTEVPCLSSHDICSAFYKLDFGYTVFQARFRSADDRPFVTLNVLVTSTTQSDWNETWLRGFYYTPVGHYRFPGYYAAAFAYLVILPYRLRIFDYFDFFSRLDLDAPFRRDTPSSREDFFPLDKMVQKRAFLFGCFVKMDAPTVSQSVGKMTTSFLQTLDGHCGKSLRSHSIVTRLLRDERQAVPGIFQQLWLGYFSSPELKAFTEAWFNWPDGHRIHRWGDQQYYFRAHALFAINASQSIFTDLDMAGCTFYRSPSRRNATASKH
jgi:hypothetical protein